MLTARAANELPSILPAHERPFNPMLFARRIVRYATVAWIATLACLLTGCPSLSTRTELPASVDRAQEFERQGDFASAARVYEQLATQNTGADRNAFALDSAHDWLAARRPDDAARALAMAQPPLSPQQNFDRQMLDVEVLIDRGQGVLALQRLNSIPQPTTPTEAARYAALKQQATQASARQQGGPQQLLPEATPHIAVLLPITGRNAAAGSTIRDGFMTAFYQAPVSQRPQIRVYDTGATGVGETIAHAAQEGAEFIVGPLLKDEITAAADFTGRRPPILALNFLPVERPAPPNFYQFALSPEDEARQVARRILADGHKIGVAFAPTGDWGTRVLAAFSQELQAGGGTLLADTAYDPAITDYAEEITKTLRISDSEARHRRLESVLGTKLNFEPRRREDIEFIFAAAQAANTERQLRPQLRFYRAGDVPTYATSSAFEPDPRANEDLEALMFPDMPWMLGGDLADAVHDVARAAWPNSASRRDRLFAFGFDAFRLAMALREHPGAAIVDGLTGHLTLDADRHVRRELGWAQLKGGEVRLLPATGTPLPAAGAPPPAAVTQ